MWILCRFCYYRAVSKRPILGFCVFSNILSKHNPIYTKFYTLVFGYVYEIGTKNELNTNITFQVIITLSHF